MPDHSWRCSVCGTKNPPYTEACRDCGNLSTPPELVQSSREEPQVAANDVREGRSENQNEGSGDLRLVAVVLILLVIGVLALPLIFKVIALPSLIILLAIIVLGHMGSVAQSTGKLVHPWYVAAGLIAIAAYGLWVVAITRTCAGESCAFAGIPLVGLFLSLGLQLFVLLPFFVYRRHKFRKPFALQASLWLLASVGTFSLARLISKW